MHEISNADDEEERSVLNRGFLVAGIGIAHDEVTLPTGSSCTHWMMRGISGSEGQTVPPID